MSEIKNTVEDFIGVAFERQTYRNILYLLFSFPLGTAYFFFLMTGLSFGLGPLTIWTLIPLLFLVFLSLWEMASFERQLAGWLLGIDIPTIITGNTESESVAGRLVQRGKGHVTWKLFSFFLIKFPLGMVSITSIIILLVMTCGMIMYPLLHIYGIITSHSLRETILISLSGLIVGLISMHMLNLLAHASGRLTKKMLED